MTVTAYCVHGRGFEATQLATARLVAAQLADELADPPLLAASAGYGPDSPRWNAQSLSSGAAGIALLHGVRASDGVGGWERARKWLACAATEDLAAAGGAGLWHGAPALAFALLTSLPSGSGENLLRRLDAAVTTMVETRLRAATCRIAASHRPSLSEFDLVRGLTGLGAYLLYRDPDGDLLRRVLAYLVRLTEPVLADDTTGAAAPGWWTGNVAIGRAAGEFAGGHSDQGMAHGITGPLSLLSLASRAGVVVEGQQGAILEICHWLDAWRQDGPAGPWWPERVTLNELRSGRSRFAAPARPSWCYGTPGIARALQLAGIALGDSARRSDAEEALLRCVTDAAQLDRLDNPSLCHGWAGLIAVAKFAAADAQNAALSDRLPALLDAALDQANRCIRGRGRADGPQAWRMPGLIDGTAGLALVLHSITTEARNGWATGLVIT